MLIYCRNDELNWPIGRIKRDRPPIFDRALFDLDELRSCFIYVYSDPSLHSGVLIDNFGWRGIEQRLISPRGVTFSR